ncbi:hypothetical protein [Alkalicoccobacillus porphyridii]|uniref:Uncharacterized protein n=1 Tax=Alkalicoccobacillus porphyridii TaxID=2597270 RepID=A0A554A209_9BACI|nr:hypothetical protein [Alkalicoccobacillus porphyridii]TSB47676.1 hypothetical protein FN960_03935 [Alkalicoccobacillus porphyridii]
MKKFLIGMLSVSLLAACSQGTGGNEAEAEEGDSGEQEEQEELTAVSVLERAEEAHNNLSSAEVSVKEMDHFGINIEGVLSYQFDEGIAYYESERGDEKIYNDTEDIMLISDYAQFTPNEEALKERYIETKTNEHQNPFSYYKEFDPDFYDKFELSERDAIYVLTYIGEEEDYELLVEGFGVLPIASSLQLGGYEVDDISSADTSVDTFRLSFDIDKESFLVKGYELRSSFEVDVDGFDRGFDADATYLYASTNEEIAIEKPDVDEMAVDGLTYDEQTRYEDEAFQYVDAVIQANIYQNVDEYVERAPIGSEEEKRESGEAEQQSFLEEFAMAFGFGTGELGMSDEKVLELTEAYVQGYSQSEYMIVDSKAVAEDTFQVTVNVQGINQAEIERELDLLLTEQVMNGNLNEETEGDEMADAIIDALDRLYGEGPSLNEARDITVEVVRAGGSYILFDHSEYINGFISPY